MFGRWVFAAIIKYVNIHAAYYVGSVHARSFHGRQSGEGGGGAGGHVPHLLEGGGHNIKCPPPHIF